MSEAAAGRQGTYPDFFNHVFGPIMQPGSSSEFAGPARIGRIARALVPGPLARVRFGFSKDGKDCAYLVNFMSDCGYLGGILGFDLEDERLFDAVRLTQDERIGYEFYTLPYNNRSLNAVAVHIEARDGQTGDLLADSTGGGMVQVLEVNGFSIDWTADSHAVLIEDAVGALDRRAVSAWARGLGPALLGVSNLKRRDNAARGFFVEGSVTLRDDPYLRHLDGLPGIRVTHLPALLPVVRNNDRAAQLFTTVAAWRRIAEERGISFARAAIAYEEAASGWGEERIGAYFERIAGILDEQIHALERIGYDKVRDTPLLPVYGRLWDRYLNREGGKGCISDDLTNHILIHAFSTNAKIPGVKLVPGPMGTGGGYLYSALDAVREKHGYSHEKVIEALAVAAGLGVLAFTHTHVNGSAGCVAESGICCAMASGALVWLVGGDGHQVENAASMALQSSIGIPCDPIPGGLEFPCLTRTFRAAVTAPLYADLALSGIDPLIPYHEMLQEIERNFQQTDPLHLCSSQAGCCRTPTAARLLDTLGRGAEQTLSFTPEGPVPEGKEAGGIPEGLAPEGKETGGAPAGLATEGKEASGAHAT